MTTVINKGDTVAVEKAKKANAYVYIGRTMGTLGLWGNKYSHLPSKVRGVIQVASREEAVKRHAEDVHNDPELCKVIQAKLKDKVLVCWCKPKACHGDTLAAIANGAPDTPITNFTGEYAFLSNFHRSVLTYEGIEYPTVEHAYQAAKTLNKNQRRSIAALPTATVAKQIGARVELRNKWESMKRDVMLDLLRMKFGEAHPLLQDKLIATGSRELMEGNAWGDRYWGSVRNLDTKEWEGYNHLGKLLMLVRGEIKE